jgi:hypothetical protein
MEFSKSVKAVEICFTDKRTDILTSYYPAVTAIANKHCSYKSVILLLTG